MKTRSMRFWISIGWSSLIGPWMFWDLSMRFAHLLIHRGTDYWIRHKIILTPLWIKTITHFTCDQLLCGDKYEYVCLFYPYWWTLALIHTEGVRYSTLSHFYLKICPIWDIFFLSWNDLGSLVWLNHFFYIVTIIFGFVLPDLLFSSRTTKKL